MCFFLFAGSASLKSSLYSPTSPHRNPDHRRADKDQRARIRRINTADRGLPHSAKKTDNNCQYDHYGHFHCTPPFATATDAKATARHLMVTMSYTITPLMPTLLLSFKHLKTLFFLFQGDYSSNISEKKFTQHGTTLTTDLLSFNMIQRNNASLLKFTKKEN